MAGLPPLRIPWHIDDDALIAIPQERRLKGSRQFVVQEVLVPAADDQFRNNNDNDARRMPSLDLPEPFKVFADLTDQTQ